jgi:hypothetical protein
MKTVYLLKNSLKSFKVLLKLVKIGDITTNIIVVDRFYSKILRKDKRVTEFPFIINTLPSFNGLIPKISKVLPFRIYYQIINTQLSKKKKISDYNCNFNKGRIITYNPPSITNDKKNTHQKLNPRFNYNYKKPIIRAIKQKDQSVNIILYNK